MTKHERRDWERSAAIRSMQIDYRQRTMMPIRDMHRDGRICFWVIVYGLEGGDICVVPGGSDPMVKAVRRLGLDPNRFQAMLMDVRL